MTFKHQTKIFLAYTQATLLMIIISSGMLFMHKHQTSSGKIVIHVHPYNLAKDQDATKHYHTDAEAHFLDVVFNGSYLQTNFVAYESPSPINLTDSSIKESPSDVIASLDHKIFLRGPPLSLV